MNHQALSAFIWSVAVLFRGDYKQSHYCKVILPFTVLRRLDSVLEPTKAAVLAEKVAKEAIGLHVQPHGSESNLDACGAGRSGTISSTCLATPYASRLSASPSEPDPKSWPRSARRTRRGRQWSCTWDDACVAGSFGASPYSAIGSPVRW